MFDRLHRLVTPLTLSKALDIVVDVATTGPKRAHWFDTPVGDLIQFLGNKRVDAITPADIFDWYEDLRKRPSKRHPGRTLSPYTIDSYGRSVRRFFRVLVQLHHLEASPARRLKLPSLPQTSKKEISIEDIEKLVQVSEINPRDHAIVLCLRDSGCRVGELLSMTASGLHFEPLPSEEGVRLRARSMVLDDKTGKARYIFFGHQSAVALQRYLRVRHHAAPDVLWLSHGGRPISRSGIYQALKRLARRAGIEGNWNPHAFRHALAKRLIEQGANHKALQSILGHADVRTTLQMYVNYDDEELANLHSRFSGYK